MTVAQSHERGEARTAVNHIVLSMYFKPQAIGPRRQRFMQMLQLEAEACGNAHR
jgi:hypothetical protein